MSRGCSEAGTKHRKDLKMIRVLGMFLVIFVSGIGSMLLGLDPISWMVGVLTAAIAIRLIVD